jgi:hypothetical protein
MQIPKEIKKCVVFLGYRDDSGVEQFAGTAFYVGRTIATGYGFTYLVTARHVIDGIRGKGTDKVLMRVNQIRGNAIWVDTPIDHWLSHPTDASVDVAVKRTKLIAGLDHNSIPIRGLVNEVIIKKENIGMGDEIFLPGLFANHSGEGRNIPIIRIGNIAAMPEEKVVVDKLGKIDAYLVEARSISGLSGSPVYVHVEAVRYADNRMPTAVYGGPGHYLLGLMHGHYDKNWQTGGRADRVNLGIAIVIPAEKILEVINQLMIKEADDKDEKEWREKGIPTMDSLEVDDTIENDLLKEK